MSDQQEPSENGTSSSVKAEPKAEAAESTEAAASSASNNNDEGDMAIGDDDADLEAIRARVREMEEEAQKIRQIQSEVEKQINMSSSSSAMGSPLNLSVEEKQEIDQRSIYVGNVDYGATADELESHFHGCGAINRVTILCDKFSGHPKGFAYVEFSDSESLAMAQQLDDSLFRGRQIKVSAKRTNQPGISSTNRPPRGRGRGRGRFGSYGYRPRGRGMYNRRRAFYSPY